MGGWIMSMDVIDGLDPLTAASVITRLASGVDMVREVMAGGEWLTYFQIQIRVENLPNGKHFSEAGISARVRDQRKTKHGAHVVNKRIRKGTCNLYEYQLVLDSVAVA
jgi:hypothetical protein